MVRIPDELLYWKTDENWFHFDEEQEIFVINDDAPQKAKESYEKYVQMIHEISKRQHETGYNIL